MSLISTGSISLDSTFKSYRTSSVGSPTIGKLVQNSKRQVSVQISLQYLWCVGSIKDFNKFLTVITCTISFKIWYGTVHLCENVTANAPDGFTRLERMVFRQPVKGNIVFMSSAVSWYTNIHIVIIYRTMGFALFWGGDEGIPPTVIFNKK